MSVPLHVTRMYSYVICMSLVSHPYVTRMYSYVLIFIRIYSYVIRVSLVCTLMPSVSHLYVLVCHLHRSYVLVRHLFVTLMWFCYEFLENVLWIYQYNKTSLKLASAISYQIFIFSPNYSSLKTMNNVFYFI